MIQSMTGYGKAVCEIAGKKITVEIKSLNSKQLDLSTRIPGAYKSKEMEIRNEIVRRLQRGKVDFSLFSENTDKESTTQLNADVLKSYLNQIKDTAAKLEIAAPTDPWPILMHLPDALSTEIQEVDEETWALVHKTVGLAIDHLEEFRIQEGSMLASVFTQKIDRIEVLLKELEIYESERVQNIKVRIIEALEKIDNFDYDKNRFEQEMIFYIEKLDIHEEKTRLSNHCNYFRETMDDSLGQGKKLGFIAQEMGREINTMGSKSNHSKMQKLVVCMKDELEQIKEQVLNVL
jgi:uncharacterized protein (TIGR00255 family)